MEAAVELFICAVEGEHVPSTPWQHLVCTYFLRLDGVCLPYLPFALEAAASIHSFFFSLEVQSFRMW